MISTKIEGYVLDDDFRLINRWFVPVCMIVFSFFCVKALYLAIIDQVNMVSSIVTALLFGGIVTTLFISIRLYSEIFWLHYSCESTMIVNRCGDEKHSVDISQSFFISELSVPFAIKGGTWYEHFFILSDIPLQAVNLESGGLKIMKNLWSSGIIMVPDNEENRFWITQRVSITDIPRYPKVAYFQNNTFNI